ncbi:hypothetical protein [Pandoraea pneumonica]|uniref:hypothetical protein n=1 Tax=Pandoraea pneumonica TaxID=2508299 RepID=UPI001C2D1533|nr:hypothetical protein [Pandoraea pneumonica]
MKKIELLTPEELPSWFSYPEDFLQAIDEGLYDIGPWQILNGERLRMRHNGLKSRYPVHDLVPFARRLDTDDVACWDVKAPGAVQIIHDFAGPGWEVRESYPSFLGWLAAAKEEAKDYDD